MTESSVKLLTELSAKLSIKSHEKQQDRSKIKSKIKSMSMSKSMIEFSMLLTNEELNEILNFFHFNISDEMFFSNYSQKRMSFRLL